MRLCTNNNTSCFPWRKKQDSWKPGLKNVMNIWQRRIKNFCADKVFCCDSIKQLILINQLLTFYVNIFTRIQHWHWLIFIVVKQIFVWRYSMMNQNQMLMDQSYGIAFQIWLGFPLGKKKQCFVKRLQQPWPITCENCYLCILLCTPFECVCVGACPPVMRGDTVKHALTSTSSPPNDVPSIPWSPVVLPLWTPWGAC